MIRLNFFKKNKNRPVEHQNTMTGFIIYTDGKNPISELCIQDVALNKVNILIPHIGETFINRQNGTSVEYEVKDIVRTFDGKEYGVQVQLKQREINKYTK